MGPLLFEPYAKLVAERCAVLQPDRILETAAGTDKDALMSAHLVTARTSVAT
jgi:hypothetical protein